MSHASNMEKARYLPKIGLFAQNNIYSGQRDSQASQSFGFYLMWELFNADSYNKFSEARAKTMAAEAKLLSGKQQESIMRENLRTSKITLEKNLVLLDKSNDLLNEQSKNATKLFRSGLLNALQLAELMNRRVDVIEQKSRAELQYLEISTRLYQLNN
jgi:outer membrane protein TolC